MRRSRADTGLGLAALGLAALQLTALQLTACVSADRVLYPDPALERNTVIRPSLIPGAGLGAFAQVHLRQGDIIGEYGGTLRPAHPRPRDTAYLIDLPTCSLARTRPYHLLDGRGSRAHMTRVNFAPRKINGHETHLQNARIGAVCYPPYIVFVATRDIRPGEEILTSYGRFYDYGFMRDRRVRRYFCKRLGIDCSHRFDWEP